MITKPRTVEGRRYVVAEVDEPVTPQLIYTLLESGVTGVALERGALAPRQDFSWLDDFETCVSLEIDGPLGKNALGARLLDRLEVLKLTRASKVVISASEVPRARVLALGSSAMLSGELAACSDLRGLMFVRFDRQDLSAVDGCHQLEYLKLGGTGQVAITGWNAPPQRLQIVMIEKIYLRSLADFRGLQHLKRFQSYTRPLPDPIIDLDLSDLEHCDALEWLSIASLGRLHNVDRLARLPNLQSVLVYDGYFTPPNVVGVPLNVATALPGSPG